MSPGCYRCSRRDLPRKAGGPADATVNGIMAAFPVTKAAQMLLFNKCRKDLAAPGGGGVGELH